MPSCLIRDPAQVELRDRSGHLPQNLRARPIIAVACMCNSTAAPVAAPSRVTLATLERAGRSSYGSRANLCAGHPARSHFCPQSMTERQCAHRGAAAHTTHARALLVPASILVVGGKFGGPAR